jgi:hypothetical protein
MLPYPLTPIVCPAPVVFLHVAPPGKCRFGTVASGVVTFCPGESEFNSVSTDEVRVSLIRRVGDEAGCPFKLTVVGALCVPLLAVHELPR